MIETGKYSAFKGPICERDYHDAPSISQYLTANEFNFFTPWAKPGPRPMGYPVGHPKN